MYTADFENAGYYFFAGKLLYEPFEGILGGGQDFFDL
jgi:hypothetical protein